MECALDAGTVVVAEIADVVDDVLEVLLGDLGFGEHDFAARIAGSGAGMEPPADAILHDGTWHYRPALPPLPQVLLSHSPYAGSYELCVAGGCRPIADYLPGLPAQATLRLAACAGEKAVATGTPLPSTVGAGRRR